MGGRWLCIGTATSKRPAASLSSMCCLNFASVSVSLPHSKHSFGGEKNERNEKKDRKETKEKNENNENKENNQN